MARATKTKPKVRKSLKRPKSVGSPAVVVDSRRAYDGASKSKRTKNWLTPNSSANQETYLGLATLRARSRDLVRNNPHAGKAVNELTGNTIGTGIICKLLGKNEPQVSKLYQKWEDWGESTDCDAEGMHDIYGLQDMATMSMYENGEVILRRRWRRASDGLALPFQIQVLEPDFIDTLKNENLPNGGIIVQGVEYSPLGKRVAYWLYPQHPGETGFVTIFNSKRVPAEDIIHLFVMQRSGQVRGVPRAAPVIMKLRDFDDVQDAFIVLQKIAACFSAFVTQGDLDDVSTNDDDENDLPEKVEPGMITKLDPGQEVTFGSPPTLNGYSDFSKITLQAISSGFRVPYEVLTGDFSTATFSSSRMSWLGFDRDIERTRWITIIPRLCKSGIFRWFKEAAEISGLRTEGVSSEWTPPRRQMIDPQAETRALVEAVRAGLMSLSEAIRQLGYDPKEVLKEKAADNALLDELGLILDTDPRRVTAQGMVQMAVPKDGGNKK